MKVQGAGGILMKILSSRIRTKSGGACSIGTRKGARVSRTAAAKTQLFSGRNGGIRGIWPKRV